jgi:hypothetical protein
MMEEWKNGMMEEWIKNGYELWVTSCEFNPLRLTAKMGTED